MKTFLVPILALTFAMPASRAVAAENESPQPPKLAPQFTGGPPAAPMPSGHPAMPQQPQGEMVTGKVLETMDAGKYTYVLVNLGGDEVWAAGLKTTVKVGDTVAFSKGMEMAKFHSESLNRTFDSIYFVDQLHVGGYKPGAAPAASAPAAAGANPHGAAPAAPKPNPHGGVTAGAPNQVDVSDVKPVEGGKTVKDVYEQKSSLAGQEIVLRGKVVKSNPGVMGKNWLHVRDGTASAAGENDLTITSPDVAAVGDTVLVRGKVATEKDFGFGYRYDVMIEDANVTKE